MLTAEAYAFVKFNTEPLELIKNILFCTRHETLAVGVLNTEQQLATMLACKEIIVKTCAHTTNVERSSR